MTHGHEVLRMMEGNAYASAQELVRAMEARFGSDERYCTCSASGMTASELVAFLEERGKFIPAEGGGMTVDTTKICKH
ncbi:MAG: YecH family metal-binding protein [Marinilabiliaceae bacterium]